MFSVTVIIIAQLISIVATRTPESDTETSYQEELLGDIIANNCTITKSCDIIKFNYDIIEVPSCGVNCNTDDQCEFFQSKSPENKCYLCTRDIASHEDFTRISMETYIEENRNNYIFRAVDRIEGACGPQGDCSVYRKNGFTASGEYRLLVNGDVRPVYCDMDTDGGGWTVCQSRHDGSVEFKRNWTDYEYGFGDLHGEFWLGLDVISHIIDQGSYDLRFDLGDFEGETRYAVYEDFSLNRDNEYQILVGAYTGDAGDAMKSTVSNSAVNHRRFSTIDNDNDRASGSSCAEGFHGGWWYNMCHSVNINGRYNNLNVGQGLNWREWHGLTYSLKTTQMKIRPAGFNPI